MNVSFKAKYLITGSEIKRREFVDKMYENDKTISVSKGYFTDKTYVLTGQDAIDYCSIMHAKAHMGQNLDQSIRMRDNFLKANAIKIDLSA